MLCSRVFGQAADGQQDWEPKPGINFFVGPVCGEQSSPGFVSGITREGLQPLYMLRICGNHCSCFHFSWVSVFFSREMALR